MPRSKPRRSEQEFQGLLRRLELALETSQIGVWEHNIETNEILWDAQMHRLYATGASDDRVVAEIWRAAIHPDDRERAVAEFREATRTKDLYNSQFRIILPNGDIRYLRSRAHYYEGPDMVPSFVGAEWDVTGDVLLNRELAQQRSVAEARAVMLERSKARIDYAANHDYLTGLLNRRAFDRQFSEMCQDETIEKLAVMHLDFDRFKEINDKSGHAAGDAILRNAAAQIAECVSERDIVARIGGDEFVVVLADFGDLTELSGVAEDIVDRLRIPVQYGQDLLQSGASIGIAWSERSEAANLLAESDLALYQAKKLGRDRVEFFTLKLQNDLQGERQLADELRVALERGEIVPFYQVQVDARTRQIVGLEALARWYHPLHGLLAPGAFLRIAEEYGLTARIDAAILDNVLADRARWAALDVVPPRVSVNISASRLADPSLIESLALLDIPPNALVFELVETIFLDDCDDSVMTNVNAIKAMGIDIEIDDFGSGHASLIGLVKLRPKRLKIDRQLISDITVSDERRRLVASIVDIAKTLDVELVAEGVETEEHAQLLAHMGCQILQGFALGYPATKADAFTLLAAEQGPWKSEGRRRAKER